MNPEDNINAPRRRVIREDSTVILNFPLEDGDFITDSLMSGPTTTAYGNDNGEEETNSAAEEDNQ